MTIQNVRLLTFALSFCTFIFAFCIFRGLGAKRPQGLGERMMRLILFSYYFWAIDSYEDYTILIVYQYLV